MLKQLIHNGVLVPQPPSPRGLQLQIRGEFVRLTPKQEEMALAWAKKHGTPYVKDPVFVKNFLADFSRELGYMEPLSLAEVDFGPAISAVLREKAARDALTQEQRKELAAQRKAERERIKEQYGHAQVNGRRVEIGGYVVEPGGIFMGRGQHPLRGRWKEGATERDITLNLSPDAPRPQGDWGEIVWENASLWVARWEDKLSGKLKYLWLSDTTPEKQKREVEKFDKAVELDTVLDEVRAKIDRFLADAHPRRKMVATACYLIDALCLRVGDEKDEDEADTVGATTLRPEHVTLHDDGRTAEFDFLGKDSVEWHKTIELPPLVFENLRALMANARPSSTSNGEEAKLQIFPLVTSSSVNRFLSAVMDGLTAKVFRTHHATQVVRETLEAAGVKPDDPEYVKWEAVTRANLAAAELCNHTKQAPANWPERLARMQGQEQIYQERVRQREAQMQARAKTLAALSQERAEKLAAGATEKQRERVSAAYEKKIARAERQVEIAQERLNTARAALGKLQAQMRINSEKRSWNLGTSLKSYIDPRVYHRWGQQVDYDVLEKYYPKTLQRKFAWVRQDAL